MKRVLVTGGTGFVGANLVERLVADGHEVHLLVRQGNAPWRTSGYTNEVCFHEADLQDLVALTQLVRRVSPDWVFHLAVYGAYSSQTDVDQIVRTNINGTVNLVQACVAVGFESFVNTGSSSEYGFKDHAPSEGEAVDPNSYYAVSKASATMFCRYSAQHHAMRIPTLRLYSVYGPYEEPGRLIPTLVARSLEGELPPLVDPRIARDYVYVDDVVDAFLLAASGPLADPGAVYNVGTGTQTSLAELVEVTREVLGVESEPQWGTYGARSWDTDTWVADNSRLCRELDWCPRHSLHTGIVAMAGWMRNYPEATARYGVVRRGSYAG